MKSYLYCLTQDSISSHGFICTDLLFFSPHYSTALIRLGPFIYPGDFFFYIILYNIILYILFIYLLHAHLYTPGLKLQGREERRFKYQEMKTANTFMREVASADFRISGCSLILFKNNTP